VTSARTTLRTLGFGDLDQRVWGAVWVREPDGSLFAVVGAGEHTAVLTGARMTPGGGDSDEWRLEGDGASLTVSAAGDRVAVVAGDDPVEGFDQLCRVTGQFGLEGEEHAVDCLGLRTSLSIGLDLDGIDSIRALTSWFEPGEGFALTAMRSRKAKAHDSDLITAAVLDGESSAPVADPRFSTTYGDGGRPLRAGLELWVDGEDDEQYPRRTSGEATGARAHADAGDLDVAAELFRWHSRGRVGAGVYLLAQRR
jgi:hypothetical protein